MDAAVKTAFDIFSALPDLCRKVFVWQDLSKDILEGHHSLKQVVSNAVGKFDKLREIVSSCERPSSVRRIVEERCSLHNANLTELSLLVDNVIKEFRKSFDRKGRKRERFFPCLGKARIEKLTTDVQAISNAVSGIYSEIWKVSEDVGRFESVFNTPPNSKELVMDFDTRGRGGNRESCEGQLLDAVLSDVDSGIVVAFAKGEGGVGKTCAMRAVGLHNETKRRYTGGILYISLGQEAGLKMLLKNIANLVEGAGGKRSAKLILEKEQLDEVVQIAGEWFSGHRCLFLIDDLWGGRGINQETIEALRNLAVHRGSRVAFTTRDNKLRGGTSDVSVHFEHRDLSTSRIMLLSSAGQIEPTNDEAQQAFEKLLKKCDGLPLALDVAGGGVRYLTESHYTQSPESAWEEYLQDVDDDPEGVTVKVKDLMYRSLKFIDEDESSDSGERLHQERFESLCILRNGQFVAVSVAAKIWGTSEKEARKEAKLLERYSVIRLLYHSGQAGKRDSFSIGLHDLMLDVAQVESRLRNVEVKCAMELVSRYLSDIPAFVTTSHTDGDDKESEIWEEFREKWFSVQDKDDGYICKNICLLLRKAKKLKEIQWLMTEPRWVVRQLGRYGAAQVEEDVDVACESLTLCNTDMQVRKRWLYLLQSAVRLNRVDLAASGWEGMPWFQLYGRLRYCSSADSGVVDFVMKIEQEAPRPWLQPGPWVLHSAGERLTDVKRVDGKLLGLLVLHREIVLCYQNEDWDVFTGTYDVHVKKEIEPDLVWERAPYVFKAVVSADGKTIVFLLRNGEVEIWRSGQRRKLSFTRTEGTLNKVTCEDVAITDDGKLMVLGFSDGGVEVWEGQGGGWEMKERMQMKMGGLDELNAVRVKISGNGNCLATWNKYDGISVWNCLGGQWEKNRDTSNGLHFIDVRGHQRYLVFRTLLNLYVWETRKELMLNKFDPRRCRCASINKNQSQIALEFQSSGEIGIFSTEDWTLECTLQLSRTEDLQSLEWYNDDVLLLPFESGVIEIWDIHNGVVRAVEPTGHDRNVITVNVSDDGMRMQSFSFGSPIHMWDYRDGSWVSEELTKQKQWYWCVAMNSDGTRVIAGLDDGIVQFWDWQDKWMSVDCSAHVGWVRSVAIAGDGNRAVTVSDDGAIGLWDYCNGDWKFTLQKHENVRKVAISCNGERVLSWRQNLITVWEMRDGKWEGALFGDDLEFDKISGVALSKNGNRVAVRFYKSVKVWHNQNEYWGLESVVELKDFFNHIIFNRESDRLYLQELAEPPFHKSPKGVCLNMCELEFRERNWVLSESNDCRYPPKLTSYDVNLESKQVSKGVEDIFHVMRPEGIYRVKDGYFLAINRRPYLVWVQEVN